MTESLKRILDSDARVAYTLLFGSAARGGISFESDVDVAVGEYLDFKPIHDLCVRGALKAAARGR